ncbi:MAG: hypothetical protein QNJ94_01295 [Alphaproteobacteria bacterium]|nr:hypothetical protein [Alphaproteobacteria bacterium]
MALKPTREPAASAAAAGDAATQADQQARFHGDVEGHKRLVNSLYSEVGETAPDMAGTLPGEGRWPLYRTVLFVLVFNLAAWAAIGGAIYSLL